MGVGCTVLDVGCLVSVFVVMLIVVMLMVVMVAVVLSRSLARVRV